ncbi:MAG: HPr family phosphocarrier protein [Alphaproteobacteria bacterium]
MTEDAAGCQLTVAIVNKRGLHARAAAQFVKLAEQFDAEITVARAGTAVSGRSIMGLMMLAASPGTELDLLAEGPQAEDALAAVAKLIANRFNED